MKEIGIIGNFVLGQKHANGQTVKVNSVYQMLCDHYRNNDFNLVDTHNGKKRLIKIICGVVKVTKQSRNIVIMPAQNGVKIILPLVAILNKLYHRKTHYVVIGGWLPQMASENFVISKALHAIDYIYVETAAMKAALGEIGFENAYVMPNSKKIRILEPEELNSSYSKPYRFCTFSRVMKEKGIEDAVSAICEVDKLYPGSVSLDVYGKVDPEQSQWFENLKNSFPGNITYRGIVDAEKSVDVLKDYYGLIFPTYYEGEGFAGTLLDAMSSGLPVICSNWKYNAEIIEDDRTGYTFNTQSINELTECILKSIKTPERWHSMRLNCLDEAHKYEPEKVIKIMTDNMD